MPRVRLGPFSQHRQEHCQGSGLQSELGRGHNLWGLDDIRGGVACLRTGIVL